MELPSLFTDKTIPTPSLACPQGNDLASRSTRRSRKDWDLLLEQWETSGLTQQKFCKQHSINLRTFVGQRSRQQAKLRSNKKLLPIKVSNPVTSASSAKSSDIVLKLTSGAELMIPTHCDKKVMKELFIILGVC